MSRSYPKIVADYHRQYPHQVRLTNAGDWREDYCSRAHYAVTGGPLVLWFEKAEGRDVFVYGFKSAEHAEAFQRWADSRKRTRRGRGPEPCIEAASRPPRTSDRPLSPAGSRPFGLRRSAGIALGRVIAGH
jgi:hypothetical protein